MRATGLGIVLLLLGACASKPQQGPPSPHTTPARAEVDSAPPVPIDLAAIPEPVPRHEERARYGNHSPYEVLGKRYRVLPDARGYVARGIASWYGTKFHGRLTSNREPYDMYSFSAAHKTLPLPCYARVTNLDNGRSIIVRINDRGPFVGDRLIDLSYVAAVKLGVHVKGTAPVEVRVLDPAAAPAPALVTPLEATPPLASGAQVAVAPPRRSADAPGPVVTEVPLTTTTNPTQHLLSNQLYLQFGAFSAEDNARMLRARLHAAGFAAVDVHTDYRAGSPWRVLTGPYQDRIEAIAAQQHANARGFPGSRIVER